MFGAHIDSWHTGVGATDNADGVTTMVEAMRILKAVGVKPRRTIRVAHLERRRAGTARIASLGRPSTWPATPTAPRATSSASTSTPTTASVRSTGSTRRTANRPRSSSIDGSQPLKAIGARRNVFEGVGSTDHLNFIDVGRAGVQPDSGVRQLRQAHPPHEHGHAGAAESEGSAGSRDRHGHVRVPGGDERSEISESAAEALHGS